MAEALVRGLAAARPAGLAGMIVTDVRPDRRSLVAAAGGCQEAADALELCRRSDAVVLAVKPAQVAGVLASIAPAVGEGTVIVSIAAGVTLAALENGLGRPARMARVMPNTPLMVGRGMSAIAWSAGADEADRAFVRGVFASVGRVVEVEERLMDAVTALSGSGPAYVFSFIEALADGGVKAGLPREQAVLLAAQTVLGSAEMVLAGDRHPAALRDMVTSPGGTTIEGIHALEQGGFRGTVINAVEAAWRRARALGEGK
jgi:pyrroline-5-carboxylate reductase